MVTVGACFAAAIAIIFWVSCGVALARRHVGPRLVRTADAVAGAGLIAFSGVLAYRAGTE